MLRVSHLVRRTTGVGSRIEDVLSGSVEGEIETSFGTLSSAFSI